MAVLLLGIAWLNALHLNAEPEPPDRQSRQIEQSVGTDERGAVIRSDSLGRPKVTKKLFENGEA